MVTIRYKNPYANHFARQAGAIPEHHSNSLREAWKADRFARRRDRSLKGGPACCVQIAMESMLAANVCHSSFLHAKAVLSHSGHSSLSTISVKVSANFKNKPLISSAFSRKYEAAAEPAKCAVHFRPCIDIHKGKVKQIVGSTLIDLNGESSTLITNFESEKSPAEFANMYKRDGLLGGHVIMLGADAASISAAIDALHAYPGGLQVGGGVNPDNAWTYLEAGASHVIVTSYVFNDGKMDLERLKDLVRVVGKGRLVLDLSCRKKDGKYVIVTDRWQKFSDVALDEETLDTLSTYADEYLVHGVDVEGKRLGIDEELVGLLGRCSPIPVTYAGGATTLTDLDSIRAAGAGSVDVTVGSALDIFGGNLSYKDVVAWHQKQLIDSQ